MGHKCMRSGAGVTPTKQEKRGPEKPRAHHVDRHVAHHVARGLLVLLVPLSESSQSYMAWYFGCKSVCSAKE